MNVYVAGRNADTAVLLLAAAETLELDPAVAVRTTSNGYNVPEEVAKEAGFDSDGNRLSDVRKEPAKKTTAKKTAAKKTAAKKAPAKKAAAKKTASKPQGEE